MTSSATKTRGARTQPLLLSIGGLVGQLDLAGAPDLFWDQLRARYGAFTLPAAAEVTRDFVVRLDMLPVPLPGSRAAIERRYAQTEAHPLSVDAAGRKLAAHRWDFDVRLTGRAGRARQAGRPLYRGQGRCEMSPFAVDTLLRVIFATLLPRAGGMLIHACGLRHAAVGVIFPGQSGAGKTTLARKAPDADDVLSDEIVAVRRLDDGWRVFGTPFWGDFARGGISMRSWPLRTVAFLTQTREIGMAPITSSDATLRLLGCFMSFAVDRASVERSLAVAIQLCAEVRSVEAGLTRAAPTPEVFRKLAPHLGPDVTRPTPPANARELISEFRALLRKQRAYTFRPRGATAWLKAGDALSVEAPALAASVAATDVLLSWVPGATPDDDTLVCHRAGDDPRAAKGELLGRVAVAARDGRRLPIAGALSALSRQLGPMVALPVLRMAGR
ncbi:MAG TPA: hypothetical protein VHH90_08130 [Polyangia bacterium]|nr:hypothetical protein [Polyangia bacterium]